MFFERKTKSQGWIKAVWFPLLIIIGFFVVFLLAGPGPAFYAVSGIFLLAAIMPFIIFLRTHNMGYLALSAYLVVISLICFQAPPAIRDRSDPGIIPLLLVGMYVLLMVVAYYFVNRKLRWRGEEVFELAALPVEDIRDNFSPRPRPAGQLPVSRTEMIRFIDFVTRNLIAFPFREENRVIFVLGLPGNDLPYLLGLKKDYLEDTWVAIDFDGKITVHITKDDYLLFKTDLDFDQLCQSLGDVFREFLELSQNGQESRIIDRMNALRLPPSL
jgi:hypothetical protein